MSLQWYTSQMAAQLTKLRKLDAEKNEEEMKEMETNHPDIVRRFRARQKRRLVALKNNNTH